MSAPITTRLRSTDGVELAAHDFGGRGPTILFAHATGFHGLVWQPLIDHLTDSFHCVSLDFRGHGDSTVPDHGSFEWSGFADDILAMVDDLDRAEPLFGVGHSKGGAALLLAEQHTPGTFAGLYCYEPIVFGPDARSARTDGAENPLATGARRRREVFDSRNEAYDNYAGKPPLDRLDPAALRAYVDHGFVDLPDGTVRLKCRGANESAVYSMGNEHDAFDHLPTVSCPTTIEAGSTIDGGASRLAEPVADHLPLATFESHDHLGHFGPLEAPGFIATRIEEAFSRGR